MALKSWLEDNNSLSFSDPRADDGLELLAARYLFAAAPEFAFTLLFLVMLGRLSVEDAVAFDLVVTDAALVSKVVRSTAIAF